MVDGREREREREGLNLIPIAILTIFVKPTKFFFEVLF